MKRLVSILVSILFFLILIEIGVRLASSTDMDGNIVFLNRIALKPYHFPRNSIESILEDFYAADEPRIAYDSRYGWNLNPDFPEHNSQQLRALLDYEPVPAEDMTRIIICGDSFTYGDEVPIEDSWGWILAETNPQIEVLNLGVGGYGIGQAYLKCRDGVEQFSPDVVVFGFIAADLARTVTTDRWFINPVIEKNILSKPRFILKGGELQLVNQPPIALDKLAEAIGNFGASDLAPYEYFYEPADYQSRWWSFYRTPAVIEAVSNVIKLKAPDGSFALRANFQRSDVFDVNGEAAQVTFKIFEEFASTLADRDIPFLIVHLPWDDVIDWYQQTGRLDYQDIYDRLRETYTVIETLDHFDGEVRSYFETAHYNRAGNSVVAGVITEYLGALQIAKGMESDSG